MVRIDIQIDNWIYPTTFIHLGLPKLQSNLTDMAQLARLQRSNSMKANTLFLRIRTVVFILRQGFIRTILLEHAAEFYRASYRTKNY